MVKGIVLLINSRKSVKNGKNRAGRDYESPKAVILCKIKKKKALRQENGEKSA